MTRWLVAAIIGSMIAALHYGPRLSRGAARGVVVAPALCRTAAAALIAALLLDAPFGESSALPPLVALDASASWMRGGAAGSRWSEAVERARSAGGDSVLLVGDSGRWTREPPPMPGDARSTPRTAAERARQEGRSLLLITDGEGGPLGGGAFPAATRVVVMRRTVGPDAALVRLEAPARSAPGDAIEARVMVRASPSGITAGVITVRLDGAAPQARALGTIPPLGEREFAVTLIAGGRPGSRLMRAFVRSAGDVEPRNDTLAVVVEITRAATAVLVSTAPDPDARDALEALRGTLTADPRGFYRIAPGVWRSAATLAPVTEGEVRVALAEAPLAIIHGDTALLGAPNAVTRGSVVLMVPARADAALEWRATAGDDSPLAPALSGIGWDSLPPVDAAADAPSGAWTALMVSRSGEGQRQSLVVGRDIGGRRVAILGGSGLWRWRARGGAAGDAYAALWGAIIDWGIASRPDVRPALPEPMLYREGEPIIWRRGGADSVARVTLRDPQGVARQLELRFTGGARTVESAPLRAGVYAVTVAGAPGEGALAVNPSAEWVPVAATLRDTLVPGSMPRVPPPPLRSAWWPYALALALLCADWLLRRRAGLR